MIVVEWWIVFSVVAAVVVVTGQTVMAVVRRRDPYDCYDLEAAIRRHPVTHDVDDLRIPGLTDVEADEFWHAVND